MKRSASVIISASRRTDIPAFYSEWFMRRIRDGYCEVPHPFRTGHSSRVALTPDEVDAIVFWTRNPRPLMPHLQELSDRGHRYCFLVTLMDNPRLLEPATPPPDAAVAAFTDLSRLLGPEKVVWRYDPIVLSNLTPASFHVDAFSRIADRLRGLTRRCIVSLLDVYRKLAGRLADLAGHGLQLQTPDPAQIEELMQAIARVAAGAHIEVQTCAERLPMTPPVIRPGKCVDDAMLRHMFGRHVSGRKDPSQRPECHCVVSRDIGVYDTCLYGCRYCYATSSFERASRNQARHDPCAPALLGPESPPAPQG